MIRKVFKDFSQARSMKKLILALLLVCFLVLAGCDGAETPAEGEDMEETNDVVEMEVQEDTSDDEMSEDEFAVEESDDGEMDMVMDDARNALEAFFAKKDRLEFSVTYDLSMPNVASGTMTQYFKDEAHMRVDSNILDIESQTFIVEGAITSCTNLGSWNCIDLAEFDVPTVSAQNDIEENMDAYAIVGVASRTIAGVSATCFSIAGEEFAYEMCFSPEGVPVYVESPTLQGDVAFTATSYSLSVTDSVFDLPAEPNELGGGVIGGSDFDACKFCDSMPADMKSDCLASC